MTTKFGVVIPTKNESRNLRSLTPYLDKFDEVIFVDGNSVDGTVELLSSLFPQARVIHQGAYRGKGSALILGMLHSTADYVVILDADVPVSLEEVEYLKRYCKQNPNLDLVKTSRHLPHGGSEDFTAIRKFGAQFFALITRVVFRVSWTEVCYGFWVIRREKVAELKLAEILEHGNSLFPFEKIPYGHSFELDQVVFLRAFKAKLCLDEIPSFELARTNGKSSLFAPRDGLRTLAVIFCELVFRD